MSGDLVGHQREPSSPRQVWLVLHGNGGQAVDRAYALPCFAPDNAVFILEYPGYGRRPGSRSRAAFDTAARSAYEHLRSRFPDISVNVFGESLGSGPACSLAGHPKPPDRIVLVVPFARLTDVAHDHFPFLPVRWMLFDRWDNIAALRGYRGPVDIFGARHDEIIPVRHARTLANAIPGARYVELDSGHNDWTDTRQVRLR